MWPISNKECALQAALKAQEIVLWVSSHSWTDVFLVLMAVQPYLKLNLEEKTDQRWEFKGLCVLSYFWRCCIGILTGLHQLLLLNKNVLQVLIHLAGGNKTDRWMYKGQISDRRIVWKQNGVCVCATKGNLNMRTHQSQSFLHSSLSLWLLIQLC